MISMPYRLVWPYLLERLELNSRYLKDWLRFSRDHQIEIKLETATM